MFCMQYKLCFSYNWYQSGLQFWIFLTCFVSFGIKDSNFMMLEDSTINFLHGYWNYSLIKTDIDVMMLFKFDIKYFRLNFKVIASMKFSFWSQTQSIMFIWWYFVHEKLLKIVGENSGKFSFTSFDRLRITFDQSSGTETFWKISSHILINWNSFWIDRMFLFDQSTSSRESIKLDKKFVMIFFKFLIAWELFSINQMIFFDRSSSNRFL